MMASTLDPSFRLKIAPPAVRSEGLPRTWLARGFERMRNRRVVVARAPGGYGKTTLLASWRRESLASRAFAAWLTLDARDDRARFMHGLVACMRDATGNPQFGVAALEATQASGGEIAAMTSVLAGIAEAARPVVLVLDDAHLLPEGTTQALLPYLLYNLPPNLQLVIGTRQPLGILLGELAARGELVEIGLDQLRLRLDESIAFLRLRFGERFSADACARIHELADGWPIALQLIVSMIEQDPTLDLATLGGKTGNVQRFFTETLLARLPARAAELLVTASMPDAIHPDLIRAMTGADDAGALLADLQATTPILVSGEGSDWLRMHPLARRAFLGHVSALPDERRRELHWRAALWLNEAGDAEAAARHALAAERADIAYEWIGRHLHALSFAGRFGEVLGWVERLPGDVLSQPEVRLAIAWAQALSYRPRAAAETLAGLACETEPQIRYEADLILAAVGIYTDDHRRAEDLLRSWGDPLSAANPRMRQIHVNIPSYVLAERGETARARYQQAQVQGAGGTDAADISLFFGETIVGLSHLRDAQPRLAEAGLRAALERAEAAGGRRSAAASMLAAVLGAACWAQDRRVEAESVLAYRLDIVERAGPPEVVASMYVTLARIASASGDEPRAFDLLQRLQMIGEERRLPRLALRSLREQIRLHAGARRTQSALQLGEQLEACWKGASKTVGPSQAGAFDLIHRIGRACVQIAGHDAGAARVTLAGAATLASRLNHGRELLDARVLLATTMPPRDPEADDILREAVSIAETNGLVRLFADTLPAAVDRLREFADGRASADLGASPAFIAQIVGEARIAGDPKPAPPAPGAGAGAKGAALALLTAKEATMLEYLAQGMTNKELARALGIGTETIKWHLKNVFAKLHAGSRRHAVDRARLLGLL